jgi:hypothetical protein
MRLLNLAPHCTVPTVDGGARRAWQLQECMVAKGIDSRFIGQNIISDRGKTIPLPGKETGWRERKDVNALFALLTGQSYWQYKMLRPPYVRAVAAARQEDFFATIIHFLYSLPLLKLWRGKRMRLIVETHNYDPAIFGHLRDASRNPVLRHLCAQAARVSLRRLQALPAGTTLVHVSQSDSAAYQKLRPDLCHVVIENGCRVVPRATTPDYAAEPKQLIFVGSLYAQMNQDALFNFSRVFWPSLRGIARMRVVGSLPPTVLKSLCAAEGWELCANVTDAELEGFYASAHYAIAPFAYGAGSKLKLMEACGRGVPVLSTPDGVTGVTNLPPCVHVTDEPKEWQRIVQGWSPTTQDIQQTLDFAGVLCWPSLAGKLIDTVKDSAVVTIP